MIIQLRCVRYCFISKPLSQQPIGSVVNAGMKGTKSVKVRP